MKNLKIILVLSAITTIITSCKNEKQEIAYKKVDNYVMFVDSVASIKVSKTAEKWDEIQSKYELKKNEAELAIVYLEEKDKSIIDETTFKYEDYKNKAVASNKNNTATDKQSFRKSLFGEEIIGNDMTFKWVNKNNIVTVYKNFVTTVSKNKDKYSREDWDEVKLLYEALDTRKNTVEKEGLTPKDNREIATLKIKFATMYNINRVGAKSEENSEAKE